MGVLYGQATGLLGTVLLQLPWAALGLLSLPTADLAPITKHRHRYTWRVGDQTPACWPWPPQSRRAQAWGRVVLPYLIQQPISGDGDDAIPLAQAQPLDQLPGMVMSF